MKHRLAFALLGLVLRAACCATLAAEVAKPAGAPAIAMHGTPALNDPFDHLPYADPAALKGGRLTIGFLGTFDSLNPFKTPDALPIRYDLSGIGDREMPLTLALMPVLPRHKTDAAIFDDASLAIPTGSGPYLVAGVKPGERIVLHRDPNYWAKDLPV